MKFTKIEQTVLCLSIICAAYFALPVTANAMHIMEGYLPLGYCVAWGVFSLPFLVAGVIRIRRTFEKHRRALILLAMSGAFIFVISSLKIPSVTGSCSHMTGTGLAAIMFGVASTSVLGVIVLIFQAILLAHGGLTTLGANMFSMAVAGPMITVLSFKAGTKLRINKLANVFIAVTLGGFFTYCVTAMQLALAYPSEVGGIAVSAVKFLGVFAPTQIPLAVVEGLLTVIIIMGMENFAARELRDISFTKAD